MSEKYNFWNCFFLICLLSCVYCLALEPQSPRRIHIGKKDHIQLVKNGKILFEIVSGQTPSARLAAQEAADILQKAFQSKIPVVNRPTGTIPALLLGTIQPQGLDRDGFIIRTEGQNVLIAGRDHRTSHPIKNFKTYGRMGERGTLHGTYAFLERFLGARFFFPGEFGRVIPRLKNWSLPVIDIMDRPDFLERKAYDGISHEYMAWTYLQNRFASETIPNCHGLAFLGFIDRFGKTHPEYFALQDNGKRHMNKNAAIPSSRMGHICLSSKIRDEIAQDAIAFLSGKPASSRGIMLDGKSYWSWSRFPQGMPYFNIMPNDSFYRCRCPQCWKHFSQGAQETSNYVWEFFADIARKVKASGVPGKLTTMAYEDYTLVPEIDIPDNILVMVALRGPWDENDEQKRKADEETLIAWTRKLNDKVWIWTYPLKLGYSDFPGIPNMAPRAVGSFYKRLSPYIFGAFLESETDRPIYNYLNYYVFGKVAWDNNTDIDRILEDHHRAMFGPAYSQMKEFYELLEDKWLTIAGKSVNTPQGPVTIFPSNEKIWETIFTEKILIHCEQLFSTAVQLAQNKKDTDCIGRIRFIRQEFLIPLKEARRKWLKSRSSRESWKTSIPAELSLLPVDSHKMPSEVLTRVKINEDADQFIFDFDCAEPLTDKMLSTQRAFDDINVWRDSTVEIMLNPSGDRTHYYHIIVNSKGCFADMKHEPGQKKLSWNSGAKVKTAIIPGKKWTARIEMPKKALGKINSKGFPANFCRYRALDNVKIQTQLYCWSPTARNFHEIQEWGVIGTPLDTRTQIIRNGDFDGTPNRRFLGTGDAMWFTTTAFPLDYQYFITGKASIRLSDGLCIAQYLKTLKSNTKYLLSFYVKLKDVKPTQPRRGFNVRFDEGNGHVKMFPTVAMRDSAPWTRMECMIQTHDNVSSNAPAYIRFQFPDGSGTAWVDCVRLHEIK